MYKLRGARPPVCGGLLLLALVAAQMAAAASSGHLVPTYGNVPLVFEPNRGQAEPDVAFLSRGDKFRLYLDRNGAALQAGAHGPLRIEFLNPDARRSIEGVEPTGGHSNYLVGADPTGWLSGIPHYNRVRYSSVYPKIDVVFYSRDRELEYDLVLAPGADLNAVQMRVTGADAITLDAEGNLVLETDSGKVIQRRPVIYQTRHGVRRAVAGTYRILSGNRIAFDVRNYDRRLPLLIDPVLSYATYLGGSGNDIPAAIAVDSTGSVYVAGNTQSLDYPVTAGAYRVSLSGFVPVDGFVTKLSADGKTVLYSTYLGGNNFDSVNAIAADATGIYIAGETQSPDFPTTAGVVQPISGGFSDGFVAKLTPAGTSLVYSTYFGGSGLDRVTSLAIDGSGNVFIGGQTGSANFPVTAGAFQTGLRGSQDGFIAKLNPSATARVYSTLLGGNDLDAVNGIALGSSGGVTYAYVTGATQSLDYPITAGVLQPVYGGAGDAFVTKVNADGSGLVYSTYMGGADADTARSIAVDSSGSAYITGSTQSTGFPVTAGSYQTVPSSGSAFVSKLSPAGTSLSYSTYLGGVGTVGTAIVTDSSGQAAVSGLAGGYGFPVGPDAFQPAVAGAYCCPAFLTKLNAAGSALLYSTYLGSGATAPTVAMAIDALRNIYVSGTTSAPNFPATTGSFQTAPSGLMDGFVAKFDFTTAATSTLLMNPASLFFTSYMVASGNTTPMSQTIPIASSSNPISFRAVATTLNGGNWLSISTNVATTPATITVTINPAGLSSGGYTGLISLIAPGVVNGHSFVSVSLNVVRPFLSVNPNALTFDYSSGGSPPACQSVFLGTAPGAPLSFTNVTTNTGWLSATPTSGAVPGSLSVCVNPSGLPNGTQTGTVYILSPDASPTQAAITVTLRVGPQIQAIPGLLFFQQTIGGCPPPGQALAVTSTGGPLNFSVAATSSGWLSVTPASGTTGSNIIVAVDPTGLPPGNYSGTITLTAPGSVNGPLTAPVNLVIAAPTLSTTGPLTLMAQTGSSSLVSSTVFLYGSSDSCLSQSYTASASSTDGWLRVSPTSGTFNSTFPGASVIVTADPSGKADGTYTGTITYASPTASNSPISFPVTLKIGPILTVTPTTFLSFGAAPGTPPPAPQALLVRAGGKAIPFTIAASTASGGNWLSATPASATTPAGAGGTDVSVAVNPAGLAPGTYTGALTIASPQSLVSPIVVTVSFVVGPPLTFSPGGLSFTQAPGGPAPPAQTISFSSGVTSLAYAAQATSGTGWLSVSPASGTTPGSITVSANGAALAPGSYSGFVTLTVPGAFSSPATIPVTLTVTQSMTLSVTSNSFGGLAPFDQSITVSSNAPLLSVSASASSSGWLSVAPVSGGPANVFIMSANPAGLAPGSYFGSVTVSASGVTNSPQTVLLTLFVPQTALLSPPDGSTNVSVSPTLTWNPVSGAASYDVYVGSALPPVFAANVTGTVYSPPGLTGSKTYYWRVVAKNGNGSASVASPTWSFSTTLSTAALRFVAITPCRVADTRDPNGPFGGPQIVGGGTRSFSVPGSACGVPVTAQAYSLNVAVVPAGPLGYLTVWPSGQSQPVASTLNSLDGRVKSNAAIVPAGVGGAINVLASNPTHVVVDINGYFVPATDPAALAFYAIAPCRIADTRIAAAPLGGPSLSGGSSRTFPVLSSACGIPASAKAYSLNLAAVPRGPLGFVTVWPSGQSRPATSTLNAPTGAITANAAIVSAGTGGAIDIYASNATDLVIDVNGYFAPPGSGGLSLYNVTPCRVLDTRQPPGAPPFSGQRDVAVVAGTCGIPASAQAHVLSATVAPSGALGYLTLWAQGQTQPTVATLNALDAAVTSNLAVVPSLNGSISAFVSNAGHLVLDVFGYFAP